MKSFRSSLVVLLLLSLCCVHGFATTTLRARFGAQKKTTTPSAFHRPMATSLPTIAEGDSDDSSRRRMLEFPTFHAETRQKTLSAALFVVMDIAFRRVFRAAQIDFPSSLGGCGILFATLLTMPSESVFYKALTPGAGLLAKWLPVFFVPSLITLPLAGSIGSPTDVLKMFAAVVGGFFFTLLTTAYSVTGLRRFKGALPEEGTAVAPVVEAAKKVTPAPKAYSDACFNALALATGILGSLTVVASQTGAIGGLLLDRLSAIFLLSTTLTTFVFGARLPKSITKAVHPLLVCTSCTWAAAHGLAAATTASWASVLRSYKTGSLAGLSMGPGDLLLFLLGPAVLSLAVSMYEKRQLMRDNLAEVGTAVTVSTLGGLVGTAALVRWLRFANAALRLPLLSRNITSPLAMAIAGILGADVSLAVTCVVVTGVIGANFGASILSALGIRDPVARGLGMGAAAHGLGTAALGGESLAFPFAAIGMALTASAATVTVSIPVVRRSLLQLALG